MSAYANAIAKGMSDKRKLPTLHPYTCRGHVAVPTSRE